MFRLINFTHISHNKIVTLPTLINQKFIDQTTEVLSFVLYTSYVTVQENWIGKLYNDLLYSIQSMCFNQGPISYFTHLSLNDVQKIAITFISQPALPSKFISLAHRRALCVLPFSLFSQLFFTRTLFLNSTHAIFPKSERNSFSLGLSLTSCRSPDQFNSVGTYLQSTQASCRNFTRSTFSIEILLPSSAAEVQTISILSSVISKF